MKQLELQRFLMKRLLKLLMLLLMKMLWTGFITVVYF